MPAGLISSLAKQYGADTATVEGYWRACADAIKPGDGGGPGYGVVVNCVKAKLRNRKSGRKPK